MFEAMPAIVELFGHQRIAGKISDVTIGGAALIRVDVPEADGQPGFTKFYGTGAIYAITPTDEATMLLAVKSFRAVPIERYTLTVPTRASLPEPDDDDYDETDDFEEDEERL